MSTLSELLPAGGGGQNQVEFTASGTLPNGKPVILKSDGTVEVVGETSTSISESIPAGTSATYNSATHECNAVACDPNTSGTFVIAYGDTGNSEYGTAIVGTVSGTSITFGSEYVFYSESVLYIDVSFDPHNAGKFVIAYQKDGGNEYGTAIVGNVTGTVIDFESPVTFEADVVTFLSIDFDPKTANSLLIAYSKNNATGKLVEGTLSGNTLSFSSSSTFASAGAYVSVAFDPTTAGKFIVAYQDNSNVVCRAGTVSGGSFSYGSVGNTAGNTYYHIQTSFDPNTSGRFVIGYSDSNNSGYGTCIAGTLSGTSISLGTAYVFRSANSYNVKLAFDPYTDDKFVLVHRDTTESEQGRIIVGTLSSTTTISFGSPNGMSGAVHPSIDFFQASDQTGKFVTLAGYTKAVVGQMASSIATTNLTASNLLGISAEAAASGATAKIDTWGGLNESQSGLTIGSDYYVQEDGTLSTTSTAPAQQIGKAVSATTINMRDLT
ncbi:MAG: hypothetical protein GY918_08980 [Gammaproteobacteria bacterium]|nr:hypothetical protein [Gammaproteobacteria bacterium]